MVKNKYVYIRIFRRRLHQLLPSQFAAHRLLSLILIWSVTTQMNVINATKFMPLVKTADFDAIYVEMK